MSNPTTSQKRVAKLILDRWKAEFQDRDKKFEAVSDNFDDLVSNMHLAEVPFELAEENINAAILEHYPSSHIAKMVWKSNKAAKRTEKDFSEFFNDWKKAINSEGKKVFYAYYALPSDETAKENKKTSGAMSDKEYRTQRRYADSFPVLDTSNIDNKIREHIEHMESDFMKAVLGDSNE